MDTLACVTESLTLIDIANFLQASLTTNYTVTADI